MKPLLLYLLKIGVLIGIFLSVRKMAAIAFPYLQAPYPTNIDFLLNKQTEVRLWYWLAAFYLHISTAVIALSAGFIQFSSTIMYQYPRLHRTAGKIYIFTILFLAAPTGLLMGFYGEGGILAQIAFICQALAWWGLTYMAYRRIKSQNLQAHAAYMMRSYALGLSAISLRATSFIFALIKDHYNLNCPDAPALLCHPTSYIFIAWTSWIINWLIADFFIFWGIYRYYKLAPIPFAKTY